MTSCPHCNKKMKMLDILGMDNWKPTACSYCNKLSMATDKSLILWFIIFLASIGSVFYSLSAFVEIDIILAVPAVLLVWPLTFSLIVKAKKYRKRRYWLPKSRLLGYFVYLGVPIFVIILALAMAIHFEFGM